MRTMGFGFVLMLPLASMWAGRGAWPWTLAGAVLAAVLAAIVRARRADASFPTAAAVVLSAATLAVAGGLASPPTASGAATLAAALAMALGVAAGRPWTAIAAGADRPGLAADPVFLSVNGTLSGLWSLVVGWQGVATLAGFGALAHAVPAVLAGVASAFLPDAIARRALERRRAVADPWPWPEPDSGSAASTRPASASTTPAGAGPSARDADVVVIGAGIGSLTAAALLARAGARVTVLERHEVPGGFCHCWTGIAGDDAGRLEFRFDGGVHDVSGWFDGGPVRSLLRRLDLGEAIDWRRLDHAYVDASGRRWDAPRDWDAFVDALARRDGGDGHAVRALLADVRAIHEAMYSTAAGRGGVPGLPPDAEGMLAFARRHPIATRWMEAPFEALLRHHGVPAAAAATLRSLAGYVTHRADALRVRDYVPILGYHLHGGFYPAGGSGTLSQWLADSVRLDGGEVRLGVAATRIDVSGPPQRVTGVTLADGTRLRAGAVVLNGDLIAASRELLSQVAWPPAFGAMIEALAPATSMFSVHLGVRGEPPALPPIVHLAGPGIEVVLPCVVDPTAAPAGYHTVELMRLTPPGEAATWFGAAAAPDAYAARKAAIGDAMIDAAQALLPGLRERIVFRRDASPATFRRFCGTTNGAVYGIDAPPGRVPRRTPVIGLAIAGSATHGPGVEAAMIAGADAADALRPGLLRGGDPSAR